MYVIFGNITFFFFPISENISRNILFLRVFVFSISIYFIYDFFFTKMQFNMQTCWSSFHKKLLYARQLIEKIFYLINTILSKDEVSWRVHLFNLLSRNYNPVFSCTVDAFACLRFSLLCFMKKIFHAIK